MRSTLKQSSSRVLLKNSLLGASAFGMCAFPAQAVEPLWRPGNYESVCQILDRTVEKAGTFIRDFESAEPENGFDGIDRFIDGLVALAFAPETRLTVDADDIEGPMGAAEQFHQIEDWEHFETLKSDLAMELSTFGRKYSCEVVVDWSPE